MTHWRAHPSLKDKFHPEFPDDIQVVVHDGGPRISDRHPELMWVRVTKGTGSELTGTILNQPDQLDGIQKGSVITFLVPEGGPEPVMVTQKYLRERSDWIVHPCNRCGFTELLDAPSDLICKVFPNFPADSKLDAFSAICGLCSGAQVVQSKDAELEDEEDVDQPSPSPAPRKWWQLWK